jgi:hypothetical protein
MYQGGHFHNKNIFCVKMYLKYPTSSPMRFWHFKYVKYANTPSIWSPVIITVESVTFCHCVPSKRKKFPEGSIPGQPYIRQFSRRYFGEHFKKWYNPLKTRDFEKISKRDITRPKWKDFKNNSTTWKLVSIPFKWVPMLWGFNRVVNYQYVLHSDFGDKSRPPSLKG